MSLLGFIGRVLFILTIVVLASPFIPLLCVVFMLKDVYDTDL